jgi:hypothetical protein
MCNETNDPWGWVVHCGIGGRDCVVAGSLRSSTAAPAAASGQYPVLINTCLISNDVRALAAFYQLVLRIPPKFDGEGYAEFNTGAGVLTIFDARARGY